MGKARFSTWVTPTKAEFRESELFLLPQIYWRSPRATVPKQRASDGNAQIGNGCKEPAVRKCLDVYLGPTSHKGKTNLSEASLAVMQQEFVVPQSQLEWFGSQWQSCPDNLLLCSAHQDSPTLATKALLRLSSSGMLFHGAQPQHCSEPPSSQHVPHITVPQEPPLPLPGTEQNSLFSKYSYVLPSSFYTFF